MVFIISLYGLSTLRHRRWFLDNRLWRVHNLRLVVRWILCVYSLFGPLIYVFRMVLPIFPPTGEDDTNSIQVFTSLIVAIVGTGPGLLATYVALCLALNRDFRKWRPAPL
jgi:amino acid transporter